MYVYMCGKSASVIISSFLRAPLSFSPPPPFHVESSSSSLLVPLELPPSSLVASSSSSFFSSSSSSVLLEMTSALSSSSSSSSSSSTAPTPIPLRIWMSGGGGRNKQELAQFGVARNNIDRDLNSQPMLVSLNAL